MFVNSVDLLSIVPKAVPAKPPADGTFRGPVASTIGKGDLSLFAGLDGTLVGSEDSSSVVEASVVAISGVEVIY